MFITKRLCQRSLASELGVHQMSALSPVLFVVVMQEATKEARGEGLKELLCADDLVLMAE